jgi:ABC-type phosphate transport system substrate-binding protein
MATRSRLQVPRRRAGRCRWLAVLLPVSFLVWLACSTAMADSPPPFRVIVNAKNPATALSRDTLADLFLKKSTRWSDGETVRPVDLRPKSETRRKFSENVLKRSVAAVRSYWQQRIFSGRGIPPPELESDEDVVGYVARHRGAVGYVSAGAALAETKVVVVK